MAGLEQKQVQMQKVHLQATLLLPRVRILFCTQCKWMLRAAYVCILWYLIIIFFYICFILHAYCLFFFFLLFFFLSFFLFFSLHEKMDRGLAILNNFLFRIPQLSPLPQSSSFITYQIYIYIYIYT